MNNCFTSIAEMQENNDTQIMIITHVYVHEVGTYVLFTRIH